MTEPTAKIPAATVLENTSLCRELNQHELDELASITTPVTLESGERLCREGEQGASAFVIVAGAIEVYIGDGPTKQTLAVLKPFEIIGELSLLEPELRTASAIAIQPTTLLEIRHDRLQELRDVMSSAAFKLIRAVSQLICRRIRDINALIEAELARNDAKHTELAESPTGLARERNPTREGSDEVLGMFRRLFKGN